MDHQKINIEKIIRGSKSTFIRNLPGFIIRLIEKIICQDEMNETLEKNAHKEGISFVNAVLEEWNVQIIVKGFEIPSSGRFVFVANHPVGAMDSLAFLSLINRYFPDVVSPSNELFNYIPQLRSLIVGVNVFGKNTRETAEKINLLYGSGSQVMIFPAGEVSRWKSGKIEDPDWQKSFITKAIEFKRDIIPVYISGRNSNMFYFIARLRKLLGIRLYIETVLLPREMIKQRDSKIELTAGQPVPWETFTEEKTHHEWAREIKKMVYNIPLSKHELKIR